MTHFVIHSCRVIASLCTNDVEVWQAQNIPQDFFQGLLPWLQDVFVKRSLHNTARHIEARPMIIVPETAGRIVLALPSLVLCDREASPTQFIVWALVAFLQSQH